MKMGDESFGDFNKKALRFLGQLFVCVIVGNKKSKGDSAAFRTWCEIYSWTRMADSTSSQNKTNVAKNSWSCDNVLLLIGFQKVVGATGRSSSKMIILKSFV